MKHQNCPWQFVLQNSWNLRLAVAILEKVPVTNYRLHVANFKKSACVRPKVGVANFNWYFATGSKKCHGGKKTLRKWGSSTVSLSIFNHFIFFVSPFVFFCLLFGYTIFLSVLILFQKIPFWGLLYISSRSEIVWKKIIQCLVNFFVFFRYFGVASLSFGKDKVTKFDIFLPKFPTSLTSE